ncbi:hypothetical protein QR98_0101210 [Sarcoptes scabiei]|uniref:Uncharacterized protein n=1 Tax=Sarcoptes scabiei TaxID=52283 RepID=A0A132AKK2_SARSC|nr:hypothetical protein QR98_0101210 [Sarcoptes scabiei]
MLKVTIMVIPLVDLISEDIAINNRIKVNHTTIMHVWMIAMQAFIYLSIIEYSLAIAWAHFVTDKANHQRTIPEENTFLRGYYFGNRNFYSKIGNFFDRFLYFCFGEIDFKREPYVRNKIDYLSRVLFLATFISFVSIYVLTLIL